MSDHDHRRGSYLEDDPGKLKPPQPSSKHGDVATSNAREIVHCPNEATMATRTMGQGGGVIPSNESVHEAGTVSFAPTLDGDMKESNKLEHAPGTVPFAPTMSTSRPTNLRTTDHCIGSNSLQAAFSVPTSPPIQDRAVSYVSFAENNVASENEVFIPEATTVEDSPAYAQAYVTSAVDNGDSPTKTEWPQLLTQVMRYGIVAGVLSVIALFVTLVVLFVANRPPAVAPTTAPAATAAPAKVHYVLYQVAWSATIASDATLLTPTISDLELTCLSGGSLELGLITTFLDGGELPVCTAESNSTRRCTQAPAPQTGSDKVLDATISFQCHGTNLDQLVGQARLFNTTLTFEVVEKGLQSYAFHMIELQIAATVGDRECTSFSLGNRTMRVCSLGGQMPAGDTTGGGVTVQDSKCSDIPLMVTFGNLSIGFCATDGSCTSNGVSECTVMLEGRSMVQQDPVNKNYIH